MWGGVRYPPAEKQSVYSTAPIIWEECFLAFVYIWQVYHTMFESSTSIFLILFRIGWPCVTHTHTHTHIYIYIYVCMLAFTGVHSYIWKVAIPIYTLSLGIILNNILSRYVRFELLFSSFSSRTKVFWLASERYPQLLRVGTNIKETPCFSSSYVPSATHPYSLPLHRRKCFDKDKPCRFLPILANTNLRL